MLTKWKIGIGALLLTLAACSSSLAFDVNYDISRAMKDENSMYSIQLGMSEEDAAAVYQKNEDCWALFQNDGDTHKAISWGDSVNTELMYTLSDGKVKQIWLVYQGQDKKQMKALHEFLKKSYTDRFGKPYESEHYRDIDVYATSWISSDETMMHVLTFTRLNNGTYSIGFTLINNTVVHRSNNGGNTSSQSAPSADDSIPTFTV